MTGGGRRVLGAKSVYARKSLWTQETGEAHNKAACLEIIDTDERKQLKI